MVSKKELLKYRALFSETDLQLAAAFKVLSDINRYRIFRILSVKSKISVSTIARTLDISLPLASQHIKILVQANLLHKERRGKNIFPTLEKNNPLVKTLIKTIAQTSKLAR